MSIRFPRILSLFLLLSVFVMHSRALSESQCTQRTYGYSEQGRELTCWTIGQADAPRSLLLVFGVHGFEDAYDRDGEVLSMIAHRVIDYYQQNPETLGDLRLHIIPCANPDGLLEGTSKNRFGRCNANGIDINRDFPVNWSEDYHSRNKTGTEPFTSAEARALRDLVLELAPAYAVDVHGWINGVYGSGVFAECLAQQFDMRLKAIRSGGTLAEWLATVADEAVLLELPASPNEGTYVDRNSERLIESIRMLAKQ